MTSMRLSSEQVTQLVDLLSALATAPGTSAPACRLGHDRSRHQPPVTAALALLAGVLPQPAAATSLTPFPVPRGSSTPAPTWS